MYKLIVVGGKLRGQEFTLEEGENTVGRDQGCDVSLSVDGVSKNHLKVTVTNDVLYLEDMGSSNGTFLNGKIITRATAKNGDKIALPDLVIQVVHVKEKKKVVKKKNEEENDEDDPYGSEQVPDNIFGKVIHFFKFKVMPVIHGVNEEYEWRVLFGIILSIFIVVTVTLIIYPVLKDTKNVLLYETAKRASFYAEVISRTNASALEQKKLDQVDTGFLKNQDGVKSYVLFDLEGRIVRPLDKLNDYIKDPFSVRVREWAMSDKGSSGKNIHKTILSDGEIGVGKTITAYNPKTGNNEPVGIIAIKFAPRSLAVEATKSQKAYLESIVTAIIVAIFFYGIIYFMTIRPIEELKIQTEESLRGKRKNIESNYLFSEIDGLRSSVNSLIQRNRELQSEGDDDFAEIESDEQYIHTLKEFLNGAGVPGMVLDSEKKVKKINTQAEDITGIRESSAEDMDLFDVAREQGFAARIIELADNSANAGGDSQQGEYEIQGEPYSVYVASLLGKDNFAKAFYVTFVKEE